MTDIKIRRAESGDFDELSRFIAGSNRAAENQCLHSDDRADTARARLVELEEKGEGRFVVGFDASGIVAACGAEIDENVGRAWIWGPFAQPDRWDRLSEPLFEYFEAVVPPSIRRLDAFPNAQNARARAFFRTRGYEEQEPTHVYVAERAPVLPPPGIVDADDGLRAQAAVLHDAQFPNGYLRGSDFVARQDERHRLFVDASGGELRGYLFAELFEEDGEGYVHYIAVAPESRGRGTGIRLLTAALHWLFEENSAPRVSLTVRGDLGGAMRLYERAGFVLDRTGIPTRFDRGA